MKTALPLALTIALGAVSVPAMAQFQKPEDAVKYRKSALTVMANHFSRIGAMANGRAPFDAKVAADSAAIVETMSRLPWEGFVAGSDKGETAALPVVWTEPAKFKEAQEKLQAATTQLAAAAKTGNLDSVKTAFGATAQSCKACHDAFRK
ncbi:cytochrome c [Hydrogenophaga sp.]|uniref:c-type cytochrome n=1 Tax=Hydrogenophaga sp. TaxID=1904254 RepID=UPI0026145A6F|nr:cytochrome c [Hydrogenophaga sp.]MCW5655964.1 cytochrome c [Hydrogenophaga sp.]